LRGCQRGVSPPTVRFYSWRHPAISIGHGRLGSDGVDLEACRCLGMAVVQRPTGGRVVLHGRDFTYSVTAPIVAPPRSLYQAVCDALVAGLRLLGVAARRTRPSLPRQRGQTADAVCFASFSRDEVEVGGRKLIGSAQRRARGCFLQQGSMPLHDPIPGMRRVLNAGVDPAFSVLLRQRVTWLGAHVRLIPSWEPLVGAMAEGFRSAWKTQVGPGKLHPWELRRAEELFSGALPTPGQRVLALGGAE
jgi:lipoate-protein ligase A